MNVYDFDKTIYDGDSTIDFWIYCLKRHPVSLWRVPGTVCSFVLFRLGLVSREKFKEYFYRFLKDIPDCASEVKAFWNNNIKKIKPWYLAQKKDTDVIVSASPDFIISEACARLNIALIASKVDVKTGALLSKNCRGNEKVIRFYEKFPEAVIENFYSDSKSDFPLAKLANNAYLVKNNSVSEWKKDDNSSVK